MRLTNVKLLTDLGLKVTPIHTLIYGNVYSTASVSPVSCWLIVLIDIMQATVGPFPPIVVLQMT